jgi:hypothetical protein
MSTGIGIFLFGIITREAVQEYTIWYVGIGAGLIMLGAFLLKWSWMNIQLWPDKIILGKLTLPIQSIGLVRLNKRRGTFSVSMRSETSPLVWRVPKEKREYIMNYLEDWCNRNYVTCLLRDDKTE